MNNTGGPAFPTYHGGYSKCDSDGNGMTLRDYFAVKALLVGVAINKSPLHDYETRARYAYELADAMMKAREQ